MEVAISSMNPENIIRTKMSYLKVPNIFVYLIAILFMINDCGDTDSYTSQTVAITAWNMNCTFNSAGPYIHRLFQNNDFLFLSEHGLYNCELWKLSSLDQNKECFSKSSKTLNDINFGKLPGNGGCAFLWRKNINIGVKPLPHIGTDRIIVIELSLTHGSKMYVIGVYIPYYGCKIANPEYEMNVLEDIILEYKHKGSVMVVGDTNSHINLGTLRSWGATSINGKSFMKIMNRCNMIVTDLQDTTIGPNFTFCSGNRRSYIDHCAISLEDYYLVKTVEVLSDEIENTSDHLALRVELHMRAVSITDVDNQERVAWHKISPQDITELYTNPLEEYTRTLLLENGLDPDIVKIDQPCSPNIIGFDTEAFSQSLTSNILKASDRLPKIKFNKGLKPYWDTNLNSFSKDNKKARADWIREGKPREAGNRFYINYKNAKRQFRKAQRQKKSDYETKCIKELCETQELDEKYFWFNVNKNKKKSNRVNPIQDESGKLLTEASQIRDE